MGSTGCDVVVPYLGLSCITHGDKIARSEAGLNLNSGVREPLAGARAVGRTRVQIMTFELPSYIVWGKSLKVLIIKWGKCPSLRLALRIY